MEQNMLAMLPNNNFRSRLTYQNSNEMIENA